VAAGVSVVVLGAGLSGLAAACHLRGAGHDVVVLERELEIGGRSGRLEQDGYRFDTGPVVMTMPDLLAEPLLALGADPGQLAPMRRLDPAYRGVFHDGSELRVRADLAALREEIARLAGDEEARGFDRFVPWLEALHDVEFDSFIDRNYRSVLDLAASPAAAVRLLRLGGLGALGPAVARSFRDPRLQRMFSFQALYAGVAPARARALFAVITYMDSIRGVFWPEGGIYAVPQALATAFTGAGGTIHTGVTAKALLRGPGGRVVGVETADGARLAADAVVCTLDLPLAYKRLLPDLTPPRAARRGDYSPSAVVWHVGSAGIPAAGVEHHNIHFGAEWEGAFEALIDRRELMKDPSRLVTVPTVTDPSLAPEGHTAMYVLEPVPHLGARLDWTVEGPRLRGRLLDFLSANGYPTEIRTERLVTPVDWAAQGMHLGTPFALAHTFGQSGPFRPSNVDRRIPGLVFAGSGTTPGVGVPMVLVSGKLAAERVADYLRPIRGGAA
jgi:phytoene desaturase